MTLIHCAWLTMTSIAKHLLQTDDAKHRHFNVAEYINLIITNGLNNEAFPA
jgi:hypothetical protein